jgi:hypothetical protein
MIHPAIFAWSLLRALHGGSLLLTTFRLLQRAYY